MKTYNLMHSYMHSHIVIHSNNKNKKIEVQTFIHTFIQTTK